MSEGIRTNFSDNEFISTKELVVRDKESVEKLHLSMRTMTDDETCQTRLLSLQIRGEKASVELLELMSITDDTKIYLSDTSRATQRTDKSGLSVITPWPITPMRILILVHELSHVLQGTEWEGASEMLLDSGVRKTLITLLTLDSYGFKVEGHEDFREALLKMYNKLLLSVRSGKYEQNSIFKEVNKEYVPLREKYPVILRLAELYEPLIEQDAHARTNTILAYISETIGVDINFIANEEPGYYDKATGDKLPYHAAYDVLSYRKLDALHNPGATIAAMCQDLGIGIAHTETAEMPSDILAAAERMRAKIVI